MRLFSKKSHCNYYGHYGSRKSVGAVGIDFLFLNVGCRMDNNNKTFHNSTIYFKAMDFVNNTKNTNVMNLAIFQNKMSFSSGYKSRSTHCLSKARISCFFDPDALQFDVNK